MKKYIKIETSSS